MPASINIRNALATDHDFIYKLSPHLAAVAKLSWHNVTVVQKMQDDYIKIMLAATSIPHALLIAEQMNIYNQSKEPLGFAHVCEHQDDISGETCAILTLLAVSPDAQGKGVGQLLTKAAQSWAKQQDYRLLHVEVFANNDRAQGFYQNLGFQAEMMTMVMPL